ncbi:di/tricarboxylate transporter [Azomonas agilis]|uniref:Di/tricarboxylate transporter n=1 Tax=Azomonas agilis TaxID=116849 RepID=A0A562IYU6_9GAMM|nr:SLC13 family permease [Azomonas agilis]TWH76066.1 di/tricarboxylate transporter [Azomonas agilis]
MLPDSLALWFVAGLLVWVLYAFIRERWSPDIVVGIAVATLLITGLLESHEVLSVLSNSAPITIACMFILSAALERTGCIDALGNWLGDLLGGDPVKVLAGLVATSMMISAFLNNTPVVAILTPVAIALAQRTQRSASKFLIPLSYATVLGGMLSMIGTSTNILVDGVARKAGLEPFGMFEITPAGIVFCAAGFVYLMLFSNRLLPDRESLSRQLRPNIDRTFMSKLLVPQESLMIGKTLTEAGLTGGLQVLKLLRAEQEISEPNADTLLMAGDTLLVHGQVQDVVELRGAGGQFTFGHDKSFETISSTKDVILAEAIVGRNSRYSHRPMRDLDLTARYGIAVLAIHRQDENISENLDDFQLQFGDVLLVEGTATQIKRFADNGDLISLNTLQERAFRRDKAPIAILSTLAVVLLSATEIMPIEGLAMIGSALVLATRCLDVEDAYKAVDWKILSLIFGMLAISIAMNKVGLVQLIVDQTMGILPAHNPLLILGFIYLLTTLLTEILSNNAVAVLVTPIAIGVAQHLGLDPRAFVVAVMFAASVSFATPIGYQTNTFVYNAGGYRFMDFVRIGLPLNILMMGVAMLIIPVLWPLTSV